MATDPNSQIELSAQQRSKLVELSERTGKPWSELLSEILGSYAAVVETTERKARFGSGKGLLTMADDFDAPLPDFQDFMQ
ncbi:MAG: hypothetical protein IID44_01885 [Planctomycetes bacterium]|nr:hypothetical protein [Planctomycetota bacterium]